MAASQMLSARDRDFFLRIGKIVFANPFSEIRAQQVREVAGGHAMRVNDQSIYEKYLTIDALQRLGG